MKKQIKYWIRRREDILQSHIEGNAWSGGYATYHCSFYYDYKVSRDGRCEQRSRNPWTTHKSYCPKCHERLLNEIRRYPIRRNLATNKMVYDYTHGTLRFKQRKDDK